MADAVSTVTFLFTDIEGSTRLWQAGEQPMQAALARHDEILHRAVGAHGGHVFSTMGDGVAAAFSTASAALAAAQEAQQHLGHEQWPTAAPLKVRMGLHTGEAEARDDDYFGTAVNRAARLMAVGHGGQVLCSSATAQLVDGHASLLDLGEHRLRDLDQPLHVFQVGDGAFAPLRSLDQLPGNLPLVSTSFIGRREEMAAVTDQLSSTRLVTLTGVGGVGKTRLALQVAADLLPGFSGGVWLCELAAAGTEEELLQVVAVSLGVVPQAQMSLGEAIVAFLRPRQVLLVLDNCEHLIDGAAELAEAILARAPDVRVLATSREGLGLPGEHVWPVRSLSLPDRAGAAGSDALALFVDRAKAVAPEFDLGGENGPAVIDVCRRLDGIPLAIELAAARVAVMSPSEIAGHLDERFRLLTGGRRGRVERHQTLRATVEWSYSLLDGAEQVVFDRLAVFPADFDEGAATAVAGYAEISRWEVIDALTALVAKSMVGADRQGGTTRYQLLETMRHFARDQAGAGDLDELRRRHAVHCVGFAAEAGDGVMSRDEAVWHPRLHAELDNLRAAVGWAMDAEDPADLALGVDLVGHLFAAMANHPGLGIQSWLAPAFDRLDELDEAQAAVVRAAGTLDALARGDISRTAALGQELLAQSGGHTPQVAAALSAAASAHMFLGRAAEATALMEEGRRRSAAVAAPAWSSDYLRGNGSWNAATMGDYETAQREADACVRSARERYGPTGLASALCVYARAYAVADPDAALEAAQESMRLVDEGAGDAGYLGAAMSAALILDERNRVPEAAATALAGLRHSVETVNNMTAVGILGIVATLLARHPETQRTAMHLAGAIEGGRVGRPLLNYAPHELDRYEEAIARATEDLGQDTAQAERRAGSELDFDEIMGLALDHLADLAGGGGRGEAPPTPSG